MWHFMKLKENNFPLNSCGVPADQRGVSKRQCTSGHGAFLENIWKQHTQLQRGKSSIKLFTEEFLHFRAFHCKNGSFLAQTYDKKGVLRGFYCLN